MIFFRPTMLGTILLFLATAAPLAAQNAAAPAVDSLARQVDRAIDVSSRRFLTIEHHSPWQILHGVLALRQNFVINRPGGKMGARVRAILV